MRHWLWYKTSGKIGGEITYPGGFDTDWDFNDDQSAEEMVQQFRSEYTGKANFDAFIAYDCPCDPSEVYCDHARQQVKTQRVVGSSLEALPVPEIKVDSTTTADGDVVDKTPGATVTLDLDIVSGSFSDGTVINATNDPRGPDLIQSPPGVLTYASGVTNQINVVAPAQGQTGRVVLTPANEEDAQVIGFGVRGWSS